MSVRVNIYISNSISVSISVSISIRISIGTYIKTRVNIIDTCVVMFMNTSNSVNNHRDIINSFYYYYINIKMINISFALVLT